MPNEKCVSIPFKDVRIFHWNHTVRIYGLSQ